MWTIDSIISIMDITIELLEPGYKIAGNSFFSISNVQLSLSST